MRVGNGRRHRQNRTVTASTIRRAAVRDGIAAAAPMLIGIVPFGLVAGAAPVAAG